jgi:hypothetical protein
MSPRPSVHASQPGKLKDCLTLPAAAVERLLDIATPVLKAPDNYDRTWRRVTQQQLVSCTAFCTTKLGAALAAQAPHLHVSI